MSREARVAKNLLVSLGTQLASWALAFAVTLYLPRYLGADGLGKVAFAGSAVAVLDVLIPLGTSTVIVKEIARDRTRTADLLTTALALRIPLAILLTGIAALIASLIGLPELTRTLILINCLGMMVGTVNDALGAALQGQENLSRQSVAILIDRFLSSAATLALIFLRAPITVIAAAGIFTGLIAVAVNLTAFRAHPGSQARHPSLTSRFAEGGVREAQRDPLPPPGPLPQGEGQGRSKVSEGWARGAGWAEPRWAAMRALALAGLPYLGWTAFRVLYGQTDPLILGLVSNDTTVGWYSAAFKLVGTTFFFPTAVTSALLPTLSALHAETAPDTEAFRVLARRMLSLVILLGVPAALLFLCLPGPLIALLHYPSSFAGATPVLRIAGIGVFLWFVGSAVGTTVLASDRQGAMFRASILATLIGIPACVLGSILAQRFWGNAALGAIASDVLLETILIVCYLRALTPGTFGRESLNLAVRCLLAGAPAAIVAGSRAGQAWGLWSILPAGATYVAGCLILGCLRPREIGALLRGLRRSGKEGTGS